MEAINEKYGIPKVIHYCWFGGKKKPSLVEKCIKSWEKHLNGYEFIEWNENNFNVNSNKYVKEAYEAGKFAFVSDYVRINALYNYGGIYLDTDVEVLQSFDPFLICDSFWGFEEKNFIATSTIGAKKENKLIKTFLDYYNDKSFLLNDGKANTLTNVAIISEIIEKYGVKLDGTYQQIDGIGTFFPQNYFSPYDYINCYLKTTDNSYAIHHFYKSWLPVNTRIKSQVKKVISKIAGGRRLSDLREFLNKI